jgi:hypothetical protein
MPDSTCRGLSLIDPRLAGGRVTVAAPQAAFI